MEAASPTPQPQATAALDADAPAKSQGMWRRAWEGWKRVAHAIGVFQTRLIMSILYFVIVLPVGIGARLLSDPLHFREPQESNWVSLERRSDSIESAHQQY